MKTNSIIALIFCSLINFSVFGQVAGHKQEQMTKDFRYKDSINFETKINPDYFLLGTFSDYMGRFAYVNRETQVDRYYPYEEFLAKYVADFIEKNYDIVVDTQFEKSRHSEIFSRAIAEKLHSYYDEQGKLKEGIFDSEEKMYSFLTGVLLRYGENIFDDVFLISVYNSPKRNEIYELLRVLECNKIIYKNFRGNIPTVTKFYFEATPRILKYFNHIRNENRIIQGEYKNVILKMFEGSEKEEFVEIKKQWEGEEKEFENSIKTIFKM
ncbi:MAG: hypothetical protein FWH23_03040 [Bacteroidales bacterium]|nr:hypothetical protein [Bacteroidales bacterium]